MVSAAFAGSACGQRRTTPTAMTPARTLSTMTIETTSIS
jgi:hypothetical protein